MGWDESGSGRRAPRAAGLALAALGAPRPEGSGGLLLGSVGLLLRAAEHDWGGSVGVAALGLLICWVLQFACAIDEGQNRA
jgi:hypothetical protein